MLGAMPFFGNIMGSDIMISRYKVQRKDGLGVDWEDIAHPTVKDRSKVFQLCREKEERKRYKRPLRLVRVVIEVEQVYEP